MFRLGSRNGVEELLLGDLLLQVWNFLPRDVETDVIGPPCVCKAVEAEPARDADDGTRSPEFSFEQLGLNENGEPFEYSRGRRSPMATRWQSHTCDGVTEYGPTTSVAKGTTTAKWREMQAT